jgi:hypothetical protein
MVAYNVPPQFVDAVVSGAKRQSIESAGRAHANPGEFIQLVAGLGTPEARRVVADPICTAVHHLQIEIERGLIQRIKLQGVPIRNPNSFAVLDGHRDLAEMTAYWRESKPRLFAEGVFAGFLVEWLPASQAGRRPLRQLEMVA